MLGIQTFPTSVLKTYTVCESNPSTKEKKGIETELLNFRGGNVGELLIKPNAAFNFAVGANVVMC